MRDATAPLVLATDDLRDFGLNASETAIVAAQPIDTSAGLGAVISGVLRQLSDGSARPTGAERAQIGFIVRGLLSAVAYERVEADAARLDPHDALVVRAMQVIYASLDDPLLTSRAVAARLGISVRTLQVAFGRAAQPVSETIRSLRLERARVDLMDQPDSTTAVCAAVGRRWGFHGTSHFVRAFERQYGVRPGAISGA